MPQRRQIARAAWIFIGLQLVMGLNGPFGLGLCVAEDGHTSIELPHADLPCGLDAQRHHSDSEMLDASEFERHPCRDVPLLQSSSFTRTAEARLLPPTQATLSAVSSGLQPCHVLVFSSANHGGAPPSTLETIRSVILVV